MQLNSLMSLSIFTVLKKLLELILLKMVMFMVYKPMVSYVYDKSKGPDKYFGFSAGFPSPKSTNTYGFVGPPSASIVKPIVLDLAA